MTIDLSGVSPQVAGHYNSGIHRRPLGLRGGVQVSHHAAAAADQRRLVPAAENHFAAGRVVSATKPAPVRTWMTMPMTVCDTIFKALAPACPDNVLAGHHADLAAPRVFGLDPATGRSFHFPPMLSGGGWGALSNADGQNATFCINDGDTHNTPVEAGEGRAPIFICVTEACGRTPADAGKFRGGSRRVRRKSACSSPGSVHPRWSERIARRGDFTAAKMPWQTASVSCARTDRGRRLPTGKTAGHVPLEEGDGFLVEVGGGGGFWDPLERDPEQRLADVRAGYVSVEAAQRDYGVMIHQHGRKYELDAEATRELRQVRG